MRLLVVVLTLLFISVAAAEEKAEESGIKYIEMTPKFTVNLAEPKKLLLINVNLLVEGARAIAAVKKNMPALKHELIMLYGGRSFDELQTAEQREALRQETTAVIRQTLERLGDDNGHGEESSEEGEPAGGFKEAFFTEFLID